MGRNSRTKICFVALNAYPAIDPQVAGGFGGIETRSWTFARALAQKELDVSFVVRHWNPLRNSSYEGVRIHLLRDRLYPVRHSLLTRLKRSERFPWLILKQPRFRDIFDLPLVAAIRLLKGKTLPDRPAPELNRIDADAFVTFGVQSHSATVIASAKVTNRPSILFLGSENDLDERYLPGNDYVSVYRDDSAICYSILKNADAIFCQTTRQQQLLKERFNREGIVIRNPIDLTFWDEQSKKPLDERLTHGLERYALWVGRADPVHKQPQVLVEVARLCSDVNFLMVLNARDDVCEAEIKATAPANVHIVEAVPFAEMPALFAKAAVLVNTSSLEGFPNTYLQAAASEVPIASLNVEEDFLVESNSGIYANGDLEKLAQAIKEFWTEREPEVNGREYVEKHHSLDQQTKKLAEAIHEVISNYSA